MYLKKKRVKVKVIGITEAQEQNDFEERQAIIKAACNVMYFNS